MYPLKFKPVFQRRIWGGQRLQKLLAKPVGKDLQGAIGESWELADLPPGTVQADSAGAAPDGSLSSVVTNGREAGKTLHELVANSAFGIHHSAYFPLLVKFLDAQQDLSVQVHPEEAYCAANPGTHLKSEAWYIIHAEPGAKIYKGLKPGVTKDQFRAALSQGQIAPLLNAVPVRPGDCHYLPSGTVHALGGGILAAEVQTPSDTTFRVFDWNRLGADGKPRRLHVEEALACINFATPEAAPSTGGQSTRGAVRVSRLVTNEFFTLDCVTAAQGIDEQIVSAQSTVLIAIEGQWVIHTPDYPPTAVVRGDTVLLPSTMRNARIKTVTDCLWLEARIP